MLTCSSPFKLCLLISYGLGNQMAKLVKTTYWARSVRLQWEAHVPLFRLFWIYGPSFCLCSRKSSWQARGARSWRQGVPEVQQEVRQAIGRTDVEWGVHSSSGPPWFVLSPSASSGLPLRSRSVLVVVGLQPPHSHFPFCSIKVSQST